MKQKNHKKQSHKKSFIHTTGIRFLAVLFIFSVIIQPLFTILPTANAKTSDAFTISDSVQSKYYFYTIESCLASLSSKWELDPYTTHYNPSKLKNLEWFPVGMGNHTPSVGVMEPIITDKKVVSDGKIYCDEPDGANFLLKKAFAFWGLSADEVYRDLVCRENGIYSGIFDKSPNDKNVNCSESIDTFSFNYDGVSWDDKSTTNKLATQVFRDYIIRKIYNGDNTKLEGATPSLTTEETYWLNRQIVYDFCGGGAVSYIKPVDTTNSPEVKWVNDADGIETTAWINKSNSGWWNNGWGYEKNIPLWQDPAGVSKFGYPYAGGNNVATTCSSAIASMNSSVLAYKTSMLPKDTDGPDIATIGKDDDAETPITSSTACSIDGIGWLVCPVITFMGKVSDVAFNFLATSFLSTNVSLINSNPSAGSTATYNAWQIMRNIANVAFVIVFLVIIFSQITNFGISNYGVKKMLPRLIIAAILVNLSFYICQVAVDISNILGYSIKGLFDSLGNMMQTPNSLDASANGFGIATMVGLGLAGGITLLFVISVPVLFSVILALLMIVLILVARTSLIVLLVVISPLAFVAFILPNTEKLFEKWGKTFTNLLLVFPIIALLFGAGNLTAGVLKASAPEDMAIQLIAMGVAFVPLFAVPGLLKNAMNAAGGIGKTLSGFSSKANGKIGSKVKTTTLGGAYKATRERNQQIKRAQIIGGVHRGKNPFTNLISRANAGINSSAITGQVGNRTAQQAAQLANKLDIENVTASKAQIEQANINEQDLNIISNGGRVRGINGGDAATRAAAMDTQLARGNFADLQVSWNDMIARGSRDRDGAERMRMVASTIARSPNKAGFMGAGDLQLIQQGNQSTIRNNQLISFQLEAMANRGVNRYSPNKLASTSNDEIEYVVGANPGGVPSNSPLRQAAYTAISNPEISQNIGNNRANIEALANGWIGQPITQTTIVNQYSQQINSAPTAPPTPPVAGAAPINTPPTQTTPVYGPPTPPPNGYTINDRRGGPRP